MPTSVRFTPAALLRLLALAIAAFIVHNVAWIMHELSGGAAWPRGLELTYLVSLCIWLPSLVLVLWGKGRMQRQSAGLVLEDERSGTLTAHAHIVAVVVVLVVQLPFFFIAVPSKVLAQITVTACVIAIFGSYAFMDWIQNRA